MCLIYIYKFLSEFWLIVPVIVPFYKAHGLNAMQIMSVQAAYSLSQLVFEVPSGYLSDVIGRRRTLIAASCLTFLGVGMYSFSDRFWCFVFAEAILGLAGALRSGTDSAILFDSLKSTGSDRQYRFYEGRAEFWSRIGTAVSSIAGGVLGVYTTLRLPFYFNMASALMMVFISLLLKEPHRDNRPGGNPLREILRVALRSMADPGLFSTIVRMAAIFSTSITALWGYFLLYRRLGLPLWSHGVLFAAMQAFSASGARYASFLERRFGNRNCMSVLWGVGFIYFAFVLGLPACILISVIFIHAALWGMSTPCLLEEIQRHTDSTVRATTLSICSMTGRLMAVCWGPVFGRIVDSQSLGAAFAATAIFFFVIQAPAIGRLIAHKAIADPGRLRGGSQIERHGCE